MSSDLLGIGSSALMAYRAALNVTGQNVANANTTGYTRQRIELQSSTLGTTAAGVSVRSIARLGDQLVTQRLIAQDSSHSRISTLSSQAAQTDGWLSGSTTGLSKPIENFFDAINSLAASSSSTASRQVVLQGAQTLASRFNDLQANFNTSDRDVDARLVDATSTINSLARQVATLNQRIGEAATTNPGQTPNELLDQRDQLVRKIAEQVGIETSAADDGSINISLGSGQSLVLGNQASTLSVANDEFGRPRELMLSSGGGAPVSVSNQVSGGVIGGLLDYRREVLDPAMARLGSMAAAFAAAVNAQHAEGMDQYGQMGGDLFTMPTGTVSAASANTGTAKVAAALSDVDTAGAQDYVLSYDGARWNMSSVSSGASIALSGSGTADDPLVGGGLSLSLSGNANAGDRFLVQPTHSAAGQLKLAISDPARLAASSPVRTSVGASNTGVATIGAPEVLDAGNAALLDDATIAFTSAGRFTINGSGDYAYTSGGAIEFNGLRVQISGTPASGDTFSLSRSDGSSGDNGNAVSLAAIADLGLLDGGRLSLSGANSALVSKVGSQAAQASVQLDAQTTLRSQLQSERDSLSGVNLDEEAADLMRYQQAYQAAAQVVSMANTLFDSLLAAVRR
jgi:flagellar hook-associated protein 1 FlgK